MDIQRLRNLTTHRLHTEMGHIYEDMETLTGMKGIFTHMIPNVGRSMEPWLKQKVADPRFWDGEFDTTHQGEIELKPMTFDERAEALNIYGSLPHPFSKLGENT